MQIFLICTNIIKEIFILHSYVNVWHLYVNIFLIAIATSTSSLPLLIKSIIICHLQQQINHYQSIYDIFSCNLTIFTYCHYWNDEHVTIYIGVFTKMLTAYKTQPKQKGEVEGGKNCYNNYLPWKTIIIFFLFLSWKIND